ncbi:hypothetical protein [Carboxylicivirga marina]|uniref:Uncharacterized protein n=1 Tax=Carboxylicivirga marina TaxID=2800988 RepID=A0ABS1HJJ9_9BACT|nr:hypothetical protein [Carboxylicivirga marina]MBK3517855.1 hypothetical protein [Carboxylicivirga marina]
MRRIVGLVIVGLAIVCNACNSDEVMDAYSERGADSDKLMLSNSSDVLIGELVQLGTTDFPLMCHSVNKRFAEVELEGNARFVEALVKIGVLMYDVESSDCYFEELMNFAFDKEYYCNVLLSEGFGVWQWNQELLVFEQVDEHDSEVVFIFPATDDVNGGNAVLSVSELMLYEGAFPGKGDLLDDGTVISNALESLKLNIKVDERLILTSNVSTTFNSDGYYNDVAMTFNPQPYHLKCELAREEENGYWMFSFNRDSEVILSHNLTLGLDKSNKNEPVTHLYNGLRVGDVVLQTEAQTGELYKALLQVDKLNEGAKEYAQALAMALNNHALMDVRYVADKSIIAKVHALARQNQSMTDEWWVDLELVFSDESCVSSEIYFEDFLTNFKVELEQLVVEFESKFGI